VHQPKYTAIEFSHVHILTRTFFQLDMPTTWRRSFTLSSVLSLHLMHYGMSGQRLQRL